MSYTRTNLKRLRWIDFARGVFMIAVLTNHMDEIAVVTGSKSFFSVSGFIFLAGLTSYLSFEKKDLIDSRNYYIQKIKDIFIPYAIATAVCLIYTSKRLLLSDFVRYLLNFRGSGAFYFFSFYFQLVIISPFLYKLIKDVKRTGFMERGELDFCVEGLIFPFMFVVCALRT